MKNILKNITYDIYLILLGTLTFFSFTGDITQYFTMLLIGIGVVMIVANRSVFYLIPIPFFIQMSFSDMRDNVELTTIYSIIFGVILILDFIKNRKFTKKGYLLLPLLILSILSIITHINSPDLFTTFAGFSQVISILVVYVYFLNTAPKGEDSYIKISKLLMYLGVLVSVEMLSQVIEHGDDAVRFISGRRINLGWENLNVIIYANLVSIPFISYLIYKSKVKIPYMIFGIINLIGIFLTLSRSSILTVGVYMLCIAPVMFFTSKNKVQLLIQGLILVALGTMTIYYLEQYGYITDVVEAIMNRDWTNVNDRTVLLEIAYDKLKEFPIFGSGGLYSSRVHLLENGAKNYHNTIAQASTLGVLGLLGFVFLFFRKTKLVLKSDSPFKWYVLIMIYVTAFVNGFFQPMYFYTTYMAFVFIVLAIIEANQKNEIKGL